MEPILNNRTGVIVSRPLTIVSRAGKRKMSEGQVVTYEVEDGIGVITVDNPPVNALGPGVREGIMEAIARGNADPQVSCNGADRRWPQLHRRRGYPPVRQGAIGDDADERRYAGREREAGRGGNSGLRPGRWVRACPGLPLPHCLPRRESRPSRSHAGHHSRRGRDAAADPPDWPGSGGRHDRVRPSPPRRRGETARHSSTKSSTEEDFPELLSATQRTSPRRGPCPE